MRPLRILSRSALSRFCTLVLAVWLATAIAGGGPDAARAASKNAKPSKPTAALPEAVKVATVEGITEYRLTNGMRVLLFPDPSKETATVNITFLVGSRHEGYGETGMAHLLEHMVFKGSKNHKDIYQELTAHGARPNGTTWYDRTNYFETFAATDENLEWALDLEADRMVNSFIAKEELDKEMTVVRNEFEIGENNPRRVLQQRVYSTAFLWHNYGKSTIGARSDIEDVPVQNLQAFYRKWYQPDNAVLVVAGKFDEAKALTLIRRKFGSIPRPTRALEPTYTVEPVQDGERNVVLRRTGDVMLSAAAYHIPAGSDPDYPAVKVLAFILGDSPSGRLYKALVETRKAATVSAEADQFRDPGLLYVEASLPSDGSIDQARDALLTTVEGFAATPPTEKEVARARDNLLKDWDLLVRDSQRAARNLSEWAAMGDWRLLFVYRDRLEKVSVGDVSRVAAAYLKSSNRTVGTFLPTKSPDRATVPPAQDVASQVKDYQGRETVTVGETFDPSPDAVEARVTRSELPSGMKVAFLPKKTRASAVQAVIRLHFGNPADLKGRRFIADATGTLLQRGTAKRSRQDFKDEVDRLRATMGINGGSDGAWAVIEATRATLPAALRLAAEALREPAFAPAEVELARQEALAAIEEAKTDPRQLVGTAMGRYLVPRPPDDPRYVPTPDEQMQEYRKITVADLKRFHADFYGASNAEAAIVGDFDPNEVQAVLNELFGAWKSPKPYTRLVTPYENRPALVQAIEAPDKQSAYFQAALRIQMKDGDPDYPAMLLGNFMTGGGFINSRLGKRIRRGEGLSYGVSSGFIANAWDDDARFFAQAIYAPENAARLSAAFQEEIARVLSDGFAAGEIAEAKKGWLQGRQVSRSQDRELASVLATRLEQGRTLAFDRDVERAVAALTAEEIATAVRRHIAPEKISMIQAGDFAKGKKKEEAAAK